MRIFTIAALAAALSCGTAAMAAGFADADAIDRAVSEFTGAPIGAPGGARLPVDRRLRLSSCDMPLALEWYGRSQDTVLVRCPAAGGWRLFVPLVAAVAPASAPVAAASSPVISRGEVVTIAVAGRGFTLTRQGEALDAGAVGEWIRVRPAGNRRDSVRARVLRPGTVGMDLP